jgi:hypothetical protein
MDGKLRSNRPNALTFFPKVANLLKQGFHIHSPNTSAL